MSLLSIKKSSLNKFMMIFIIIDLLFLPYFQLIIFPLSLPLLLLYYLFIGFKIRADFDFKLWIFFIIIAFLSVIYGYSYSHLSTYFFENIKYVLLLMFSLFYLFYFNYNDLTINSNTVNYILKTFIIYVSILSFLLLIQPVEVTEFISQFYGRTASSFDDFLFDLRFKYFFQDANTFAYFMLLVLGFLFQTHKKNIQLLFFSILVLFVIVITQSTGGLLGYLIISIIYIFNKVLKVSLLKKIILFIFFTFLLCVFILLIIYFKDDNLFISFFYERMFESDERISSGGGRFKIWSTLFNLFPMPIGIGYNLYIPEISGIRSPHSDFFGMIFRYGFLSLLPIIYFFYKKLRSCYYILIPAMITFFINSLFDSQKLLILFFLLTVISHKHFLKKLSDD